MTAQSAQSDLAARLSEIEAAISHDMDNPKLYLVQGHTLAALDRISDAALAYRRAAISDSSAQGLTRAASGLYSLGRYAMAQTLCRRALDLEEKADALGVLALVLHATGNRSGAIERLDRARELEPDNLLIESIVATVAAAESGPLYDAAAGPEHGGLAWSVHFGA